MNKVFLIGRLTRDPEIRYQTQTGEPVARYTLAVDRPKTPNGEASADFISCVAFGKAAEFAEKYLHKGTKILVEGGIRTGSYTNREGQKVYTTDVYVRGHEFVEKKEEGSAPEAGELPASGEPPAGAGFAPIPDSVDDDGLPFR